MTSLSRRQASLESTRRRTEASTHGKRRRHGSAGTAGVAQPRGIGQNRSRDERSPEVRAAGRVRARAKQSAARYLPARQSSTSLRAAAADCHGSDLYRHATQTVFGEGKVRAAVMFVGEVPSNVEDLRGHVLVCSSEHRCTRDGDKCTRRPSYALAISLRATNRRRASLPTCEQSCGVCGRTMATKDLKSSWNSYRTGPRDLSP